MVRTEQGLFFTCFQFSGKTFSFLAVERKGENSSFIGFPLILLWKERCAFSTQVDYGESIQPAARDSDPEIWSQDYGFFPQRPCTGRCVCENSAGGNWNPTRFQHFALLSIFFLYELMCSGDCNAQPELFLTLKMKWILKVQPDAISSSLLYLKGSPKRLSLLVTVALGNALTPLGLYNTV